MVVCPSCRESNLRRSHKRFYDLLPRIFGRVPMRCNYCEHRFYCLRKNVDPPSQASVPDVSTPH